MPRRTLFALALVLTAAACGPTSTEPSPAARDGAAAFDGETPPPPPPPPPPPTSPTSSDTTGRGGGSMGSGT